MAGTKINEVQLFYIHCLKRSLRGRDNRLYDEALGHNL